jgi:hypothetical protein
MEGSSGPLGNLGLMLGWGRRWNSGCTLKESGCLWGMLANFSSRSGSHVCLFGRLGFGLNFCLRIFNGFRECVLVCRKGRYLFFDSFGL